MKQNFVNTNKLILIAFITLNGFFANCKAQQQFSANSMQLLTAYQQPVVDLGLPGTENNHYGFEGGRVVKVNGVYHLFTSEVMDKPMWVKMQLGYWTSTDRIHWQRKQAVRVSSADYTGTDEKAALWSPLPVWNKEDSTWHLFYVAYKAAPPNGKSFRYNFDGRIVHAVSETKGYAGISGPYRDVNIIMQPGKDSDTWEGLQGVDSFFPYKVNDTWYAFYGSANTEQLPVKRWAVGLAASDSLQNGWKRMSKQNPQQFEPVFIENPIVEHIPGKGYVCVYDGNVDGTFGWAYSADGINWKRGNPVVIDTTSNAWCKDVRTPLGLVHESGNKYTVFYTGFKATPDWDGFFKNEQFNTTAAIGFVEVVLE